MEVRGFTVRDRNIMDSKGSKVRPGGTAYLTEELANHYNALGCIIVPVGGYSEQKILTTEPEPADANGTGPDDETEAGEDADVDAGEDPVESEVKPAPVSRRRRTPS